MPTSSSKRPLAKPSGENSNHMHLEGRILSANACSFSQTRSVSRNSKKSRNSRRRVKPCGACPLKCMPCRFEGPGSHSWVHPALDKGVILLNEVIQVLDESQLAALRHNTLLLELIDRFGVRWVLVNVDNPRRYRVPGTES